MQKPNVIVIMVDQMKATASHLYGNTFCHTPNLERMANDGVLYNTAFTPHPLCVPARVSLWTSQYSHTHGSRRNETLMSADAVHAFKIWKEQGFRTGLIGKNHCFQGRDLDLFDVWCEIEHFGFPENAKTKGMDWVRPVEDINRAHETRKNMPVLSPRLVCTTSDHPLENYSTRLIADQTVKFLEENREKEFALWVSFPDPHPPYECPEKYAAMFPPEKIELPPWSENEFKNAPERNKVLHSILGMEEDKHEDIIKVMGIYYGMVRFLDDEMGKILNALNNLGLKENTIVVFCADHGDFMGEHKMTAKGGVFYDCLTRIPLIISWPGHIPEGVRDDSLVNLIDIVPTLFALQGINIPASMQGSILSPMVGSESKDAAFSEYGAGGPPFLLSDLEKLTKPYGRKTIAETLKWREAEGRRKMIRTRDWKYVHDSMGDKDELYDLKNDPWELKNLIDNVTYKDVVAELRLKLLDWCINTEDARPVPLPK
ncbi:MAG: sulfatase-like hydrolase/transferase, partial [Clostridiaceae bacterium]|nr:sulfatase-like hydrolase/transferase [Clostridiaceae bacterium]